MATREKVHVFGKLKALPRTLGNLTTLTLSLISNTGRHRERLVLEPKDCLPSHNKARRRRCHVRPNLHSWAGATSGLLNDHAIQCKNRRSPWGASSDTLDGWLAVRCLL